MKINKVIIQYSMAIASLLLIAFGLAAVSSIDDNLPNQFTGLDLLGAFPAEIMSFNMSYFLKVDILYMLIFYNVIFYLPLILLQLKYHRLDYKIIFGIIPILLLSYPMDFFFQHVFTFNVNDIPFILNLLIYLGGAVLTSFGFAVFQASNAMNFPSNELCEFAAERTRFSFGIVRLIADIVSIIIGLVFLIFNNFAGNLIKIPGIGTFFLLVTSGFIIAFFLKLLKKNPFIRNLRR